MHSYGVRDSQHGFRLEFEGDCINLAGSVELSCDSISL